MKKATGLLLVLLCSIFIWSACSTDDNNPVGSGPSDYYFRFKVDGQLVEYTYQPESQINLTGGKYYDDVNKLHIIQLSGSQNIFQPLKNQVVFRLDHTDDFTTGVTYSNLVSSGALQTNSFLLGYYDENGKAYIAAVNTISVQLWEGVFIKFDQINANGMKGTFSGIGKIYDSSSGQNVLTGKVQITDGEFYVPRNNE